VTHQNTQQPSQSSDAISFCTSTITTTNCTAQVSYPHPIMNASQSFINPAADPSTQIDNNFFTPKAIKIFLAIVIPITIIIFFIHGLAWWKRRAQRSIEIELEQLAQEVERIALEPTYHPHPIPPPPVYIPLYRTQRNRGHPRGSPSTDATMGHTQD
jgi:hypothetical protein